MTQFLEIGSILVKSVSHYDMPTKLKALVFKSVLIISVLLIFVGCSRVGTAQGWSGGVLVGESLIIGSMDGQLLSLNVETGRHDWAPTLLRVDEDKDDRRAIYGTPAVYEGVAFVGSYDGKMHAYALDNGILLETEPIADEIVGGALIEEGVLYVGSSDGFMNAFDISIRGQEVTMERKWKFQTGSSIWSTPQIYENLLIFSSLDHNIYALDLNCDTCIDEGTTKWVYETSAAVASSPLVSDGEVYIGSFDGNFYSLDAMSGTENWRFTGASNWYWGTAVADGNAVYAPSLNGSLYALDKSDGDLRWESKTKGAIVGSPAIVSGMIAYGSKDGDLYISELSSGIIMGTCSTGEKIEAPITSDGNSVYFSVRDHSIRAIQIKGNGNPDEKWDAPYFSDKAKDGEIPNPSDWAPSC